MLPILAFLWNSTRGHHFRPWKSEYVRWRIETYSGIHPEAVSLPVFLSFVFQERYRLLKFLGWVARLDRMTRA